LEGGSVQAPRDMPDLVGFARLTRTFVVMAPSRGLRVTPNWISVTPGQWAIASPTLAFVPSNGPL